MAAKLQLGERRFTLVELLVVVAIIALLAAMLLPGLRKSRELARGAFCGSNARQLAVGTALYIDDTDGAMPWYFNMADWTSNGGTRCYQGATWASLIYPYVETIATYQCPSSDAASRPSLVEHVSGFACVHHSHYRGNAYLGCNYGAVGPVGERVSGGNFHYAAPFAGQPTWIHRVTTPARKLLLFDNNSHTYFPYGPSNYGNHWQGGGYHAWTGVGHRYMTPAAADTNYQPWYGAPKIGVWHDLKTNFLFIDGHLQLLRWDHPVSFNPDDATAADVQANDTTYWKLYD